MIFPVLTQNVGCAHADSPAANICAKATNGHQVPTNDFLQPSPEAAMLSWPSTETCPHPLSHPFRSYVYT